MNIWKLLPAIALLALPLAAWADDTNTITTPAPVIPEAAREHFVMGNTLYSNATSVADFKQAADEFQQAADLAPQWSKPRYNLAWAKEAAEDYAGAIDDLKRYQQFKLPEGEARAVQDKIYVIKAKLAKAEKKKSEEQKVVDAEQAEKAKREATMNAFVGEWQRKTSDYFMRTSPEYLDISWKAESETPHVFYRNKDCTEIKLEGNKLRFVFDAPNVVRQKITITPDGEGKLEVEVSTVWSVDGWAGLTDKRTFIRR